jgi:POT family proton-dependent oligopeptide transporter
MFQSLNAGFIILLQLGKFWAKRKLKNKSFFNFKMAMGIIIMGFGFLFMVLRLCNLKNQDLQV